jgi:hypothetical protein
VPRPSATVRALDLGHVLDDCVRVEIDCPASTTGITYVPGGAIEMDTSLLTTMAVYEHEDRCGACSTEEAHQQGDLAAKAQVAELQAAMQAIQTRRYIQEVRN